MTTILFLAALLFAIPTSGLSILAYFGFLIAKAILKAKARMHYADTQQSLRDLKAARPSPPSWGSDEETVQTFFDGALKLAVREGVPSIYVEMILVQEEFTSKLISLISGMERRGSPFFEQQRAAADLVIAAWERMPEATRGKMMELPQ